MCAGLVTGCLEGFDGFDGFEGCDGMAGLDGFALDPGYDDAGRARTVPATSAARVGRWLEAKGVGWACLAGDVAVIESAPVTPPAPAGPGRGIRAGAGGETLGGATASVLPVVKIGALFWAVAPKARTTTSELATTARATYSGRRLGGTRCPLTLIDTFSWRPPGNRLAVAKCQRHPTVDYT